MTYTLDEAAKYLEIDVAILKRATQQRQVGCTKISPRRIRYERADLDAWRATWQRIPAQRSNPEPHSWLAFNSRVTASK
jgi:excisionase family DNA binding protein